MKRIRGCLTLLVVMLIGLYILQNNGGQGEALPTMMVLPTLVTPATRTPESVAAEPTVTDVLDSSGFITMTPRPGEVVPSPLAPTATITDTPPPPPTDAPTDLPTDAPTAEIRAANVTQAADVLIVSPVTYYAESDVNVRECASTTCARLGQVTRGTALVADALLDGDEVQQGNRVWYRVKYGRGVGYVYSGVMLLTNPLARPVQQPPPSQQQAPPPVSASGCPDINAKCSELSTCEQARACLAAGNSDLDRDNGGNPCEDLCGPD